MKHISRVIVVAACAVLSVSLQAAEIKLSGNPPLPAVNLVQNPGLEQGEGTTPAAWTFATARPDNFETGWRDGGRSGKCLYVKAKTAVMSGYWNQTVPVQPGQTYLFGGHYRIGGGKMLIYVHSSILADTATNRRVAVDERFFRGTMRGHWLAPVFLPPDSLGGPDPNTWFPFKLKVTIPPPMTAVSFSLGLYFEAGEASFDDLWAIPATSDISVGVNAAAGETLRRVQLLDPKQKPVLDSGDLKTGCTTWTGLAKAQPADAAYEAVVTLEDGRIQRQLYGEVK